MARPINPKSVFVGNIPYDASEKELIEIFSEVGNVISFRLVEDRDSKKPKGYGFCEYADTETALSAIRNLNNRELNKRTLRVSYADNDKALMNEILQQQQQQQQQQGPPGGGVGGGSGGGMNMTNWNQPVNMGVAMQPSNIGVGVGPIQKDPIQLIIENSNSSNLLDMLSKVKHLIITQPDVARNMLLSNPQIALALLHAEVALGMIPQSTAQQMLNKSPGVGGNIANSPMNMPQQSGNMGQNGPMNNMNMGGPMNMQGNMGGPNMGGPMNMPNNMGPNMGQGGPMNMNMGGPMNMQGNMGGMGPNMGGPMNMPNNMGSNMGSTGPMNMPNSMGGNMGNMGPMNMGPNGPMNMPNNMGNMGNMGPNGPMGGQNQNIYPQQQQQQQQQQQNSNISGGNTPPPQGISPAAMANWNILNENQKQFVHYVLNLTQNQLENQIPPHSRNQVLQIRNLYSRG